MAELKAEQVAYKARFDRAAKRKYCIRCNKKAADARVRCELSTVLGVLPITHWLCRECYSGLSAYISEIQNARREAERPAREAEMAAKKAALEETKAENRAKLDERRAAEGRDPLPKPEGRAATPKKRGGRRKPDS